jgi:hypothetical protein
MIAVCLVLLAFLAVCQVAHVHSSISEADHCALCVVLHSAVPVTAAAAAVIVLVPLGSPAPVLETRAAIRRWLPTLFIRPPPMGW